MESLLLLPNQTICSFQKPNIFFLKPIEDKNELFIDFDFHASVESFYQRFYFDHNINYQREFIRSSTFRKELLEINTFFSDNEEVVWNYFRFHPNFTLNSFMNIFDLSASTEYPYNEELKWEPKRSVFVIKYNKNQFVLN